MHLPACCRFCDIFVFLNHHFLTQVIWLNFLSIWHLIRLFLGCIFSTELCCSEKPVQENTLLTDLSRDDGLLYLSLPTFIPFQESEGEADIHQNYLFLLQDLFFFQAGHSSMPALGRESAVHGEAHPLSPHPSTAGGKPAMPGSP